MTQPRPWTEEDEDQLRAVWRNTTIPKRQIPELIGRSIGSIGTKVTRLGLGNREKNTLHVWTEAEDALLSEIWLVLPIAGIARRLKLSAKSCSARAFRLNLPSRMDGTYRERPRVEKPVIVYTDRNCLNCCKAFRAETRFIRLCDYCRRAS